MKLDFAYNGSGVLRSVDFPLLSFQPLVVRNHSLYSSDSQSLLDNNYFESIQTLS